MFSFRKLTPSYWPNNNNETCNGSITPDSSRQTLPLYIVSWETQIKIATPTSWFFFSLFTNKQHETVPIYGNKKWWMEIRVKEMKVWWIRSLFSFQFVFQEYNSHIMNTTATIHKWNMIIHCICTTVQYTQWLVQSENSFCTNPTQQHTRPFP